MDNVKQCLTCGKTLSFEQRGNKYCSRSCSTTAINKTRPKRIAKLKPCRSCQSPIKGPNSYCSDCISAGKYTHRIQSTVEAKSPKSIRDFLIRTRGNACEECGLSEWRGVAITTQMHHIDGNPDNNLETNLRLLCPNCHSITPNFGVRNSNTSKNSSRNKKRRNLYHHGHFKDS